jgi:hypothetical protein
MFNDFMVERNPTVNSEVFTNLVSNGHLLIKINGHDRFSKVSGMLDCCHDSYKIESVSSPGETLGQVEVLR